MKPTYSGNVCLSECTFIAIPGLVVVVTVGGGGEGGGDNNGGSTHSNMEWIQIVQIISSDYKVRITCVYVTNVYFYSLCHATVKHLNLYFNSISIFFVTIYCFNGFCITGILAW